MNRVRNGLACKLRGPDPVRTRALAVIGALFLTSAPTQTLMAGESGGHPCTARRIKLLESGLESLPLRIDDLRGKASAEYTPRHGREDAIIRSHGDLLRRQRPGFSENSFERVSTAKALGRQIEDFVEAPHFRLTVDSDRRGGDDHQDRSDWQMPPVATTDQRRDGGEHENGARYRSRPRCRRDHQK